MSKRCSDWPSDASFFHGGRWVSIDEETRPIGTSPGISTVSVPPMRSGSTASTTHRAPAAGRRFARREFARQPSLRETQEREGGVLPRVQPFLGVLAKPRLFPCPRSKKRRQLRSARQACLSPAPPSLAAAGNSTCLCLARTLIFSPAAGSEHACLPQLRPRKCNRALVCCCSSKTAHLFASQMRGIASSARVQMRQSQRQAGKNYSRPAFA